MGTAYVLVALVGGGFLLHALANLSNPQARGPTGSIPLRAEAAPSWPSRKGGEGRPRVLMVGRSSKHGRRTEDLLRRAGYEVRACAGPEGSLETFPYGGCGLLNEGDRGLANG